MILKDKKGVVLNHKKLDKYSTLRIIGDVYQEEGDGLVEFLAFIETNIRGNIN